MRFGERGLQGNEAAMTKHTPTIAAAICFAIFVIIFSVMHAPDTDIKHPITAPYENEK
jgi:hypothetical protein